MIKSMTGYGKSNLVNDSKEYQVEIKSVNHRYLDMNIKMPKQLSYLEEDIKKLISSKIKRGKIEIYITFKNNNEKAIKIDINNEIARAYIKKFKKLAEEENINANIEVMDIINMPDILNVTIDEKDETIKNEILEATKKALEEITTMKRTEGEKLAKDLNCRLDKIKTKINEISSISTRLIQEYIVKLEKRIKEILKTDIVDENRLAQEVVIHADKCSIEEEITRLKSHIDQFKQMLEKNEEEPIGKNLDFLIQEMNRETNTIGSKANDLEIVNGVVDIKTELENIREQIQNIE